MGCDKRLLVKLIELGCDVCVDEGAVVAVESVFAGDGVESEARLSARLRSLLLAWWTKLVVVVPPGALGAPYREVGLVGEGGPVQ